VKPQRFIPVSAKQGDNIAQASSEMPWYSGPTVLQALESFTKETAREQQALRLPIQDVYKFDARRILAGRIASGMVKVGDRLVFSPSNKSAIVRTIEAFNIEPVPTEVKAGQSTGITLDEQIFVERGELASHQDSVPLVPTLVRCNLFWMGKRPLEPGRKYILRLSTREVECEVATIHRIIDTADLGAKQIQTAVNRNEVAELTIRTRAPIAFDLYSDFEGTGRFVLVDQYDVSGGGIITEALQDEQTLLREEARRRDIAWIKGDVSLDERAALFGHRAALVLITGGAHAGKSFLARRLEVRLVADGRHAYLLDGQNLRHGLDSDIRQEDAAEPVRRFGEVARLFIDAGLIVISTTNTFSRADHQSVRTLVQPAPVLAVHLSNRPEEAPPNTDLTFSGPKDFEEIAKRIIEELKHRGILARHTGGTQAPQYSI
jgi:bifunctional enzyme CysN/CysC